MSQENVELVHRVLDAFNRRDLRWWRDKKAVWWGVFPTKAEALEAIQ